MDHPKLEEWKTVWRERRSVTMVYILLRISVVLVMLAQIFNGNFENVFLCVLTLILFMMPSVLEKKLDITLPNTLEIIILLFIYAAEIMGEIGAYYVTFPYWDTVLHTLNGFLCAAIGFSLLDILNRHSEARFQPSASSGNFLSARWTSCSSSICRRTPSSTRLAPSCWTPRAAIRPLC